MKMKILLACVLASAVAVGLAHGQSEKPTQSQAIAQKIRELGQCQAQLADVQAEMISGNLVSLVAAQAMIEAANPTLTIDPKTLKITPKKPEKSD